MFLTQSITNFLNTQVSFRNFTIGKRLAEEIKNLNYVNDTGSKSIQCRIEEEQVLIAYNNRNSINTIMCSCQASRRDPCRHIVAALNLLLTIKDSQIQQKKGGLKPRSKSTFKIRRASAQKYRRLPLADPHSSVRIWNKLYRPSKVQNNLRYDIRDITLNKNSEVVVEVEEKNYHPYSVEKENTSTVAIKKEKSRYFIKCDTCNKISSMLCDHQHVALTDRIIHDIIAHDITIEYEIIAEKFCKKFNTNKKLFELVYSIKFEGDSKLAAYKKKSLLSTSDIISAQEKIKNKHVVKTQLNKLLEVRTVENKIAWANAYLWDHNDHEKKLPEITVLKGELLKSKKKFGNNITISRYPDIIDDDAKSTFNIISTAHMSSSKVGGDPQYFLSILQDNLKHLQNHLQYVTHTKFNLYTPPKKPHLQQIFFQNSLATMAFNIEDHDNYIIINTEFIIDGRKVDFSKDWVFWPIYCYNKSTNAALLYDYVEVFSLSSFWSNEPVIVDNEDRLHLYRLISDIEDKIDISYPDNFNKNVIKIDNGKKQLYMSEAGNYIIFTPKIKNKSNVYDLFIEDYKYKDDTYDDNTIVINKELENNFVNILTGLNSHFATSYLETGQFYIDSADFIHNAWFLEFYESCKEQDIELFGQENLNNFKFNKNKAKVSTSIASGIDWFDVEVDITFGQEKVKRKSWIEAIKNNEKYVKLDDGTLGLLPDEWFEKIKKIYNISDITKEGIKINQFKYGIVEELFEEVSEDQNYVNLRMKFDQLNNANLNEEYSLPDIMQGTLRPYQIEGYQWLCTLDKIGFGGCLADDMGLGKTIQMIALLARQKEMNNGISLVIVPRSLLFNWIAEVDKFCPTLTYGLHHGPNRGDVADRDHTDIILTTYDTATSDIEKLKDVQFNYIILDESQAIKNPNSKRYKAMRLLQSRNKLVMTGTPIENNTFDLYSQFSFINPGIFGGQAHFKERYSNPIDKDGDRETSEQLKKIIHPFLMRRTKELVAKDLPDKSENIIYCEMGTHQRKMYEDLKKSIANDIKATIDDKGLAKSKFKILDGLLRLRQICNSPLLLNKTLAPEQSESVKINTLVDMLDHELKDHNALVFSQFTSMLALIKKELDKRGIPYAYLDGQTRDRKSAVSKFQDNDEIKIFLLSLKAGNTGLNLVKADYVYIVDPWWNPAVEAQAIDRTHRIGQKKNIFAYRMICKDSIEEKIVELQNKKKKIAKDIIVSDENIFKSLKKNDLLGLFD